MKFQTGDIIADSVFTHFSSLRHYLVLDDSSQIEYYVLCLDTGVKEYISYHWVHDFCMKVA